MVSDDFLSLFSAGQQQEMRENTNRYRIAGQGLFMELAEHGFKVENLSEMRSPKYPGAASTPILVRWISRIAYRPLQKDLVGTLGMPWARSARQHLIDAFIAEGGETELAADLGEAISHHASDQIADDLLRIAKDPVYGEARWGVVLGLSRLKSRREEALDTLGALLDEEDVQTYAVTAIGTLHTSRFNSRLQDIADTHPRKVMRDVARQTLAKIRRRKLTDDTSRTGESRY